MLFPDDQEPAFANFRFWQAISYAIAFASSIPDFVCISYKMQALLGALCFGMALYYLLESRIRREQTSEQQPARKDTKSEDFTGNEILVETVGQMETKSKELQGKENQVETSDEVLWTPFW